MSSNFLSFLILWHTVFTKKLTTQLKGKRSLFLNISTFGVLCLVVLGTVKAVQNSLPHEQPAKLLLWLISKVHYQSSVPKNLVSPSLSKCFGLSIYLPWGGDSTSDILKHASLKRCMYHWAWPLFVRPSEKHLATETDSQGVVPNW